MTTPVRPAGLSRSLRPTSKVLPKHARQHNRSLVLQSLFHSGPSSRADLARGVVLQALNLQWSAMALAQRVGDGLGLPVHVANDANTGALGEYTSDLEAVYIERVNQAVADDNFALIDELAAQYDAEVHRLQAA